MGQGKRTQSHKRAKLRLIYSSYKSEKGKHKIKGKGVTQAADYNLSLS